MARCNGERFRFEAWSVLFGSGRRLYLGDGSHGIYPFVGPVVVACQRGDGGRLALGLYAGTWSLPPRW